MQEDRIVPPWQALAQPWSKNWQIVVFPSVMLILLASIFGAGQSLRQQILTQDKSLEINLVRAVHEFNQLQREINHLRLLMQEKDYSLNSKDFQLQLKITQSRFTIIKRQQLTQNLDTQVASIMNDLEQSWLVLKPLIQRGQIEHNNLKLQTQIMDSLQQLELDANNVSILNQRHQWNQYKGLIQGRSRSLQLLSIIALLFVGFTLLVGYSLIQFLRTRQRLLEELKYLATIDDLTQIPNRRYFDSVFEQEWQRMLREQAPLSLLLCDVDYFKRYNDAYGHQAGDQCLLAIAQALHSCMRRPGDLTARYGGEEFIVLLPHTPSEGAQQQANIIKSKIQELALPHTHSQISEHVTISIGIANGIPQLDLNHDCMIEFADKALYQSKAEGRNQSCQYNF